jgi:hypothetical protein
MKKASFISLCICIIISMELAVSQTDSAGLAGHKMSGMVFKKFHEFQKGSALNKNIKRGEYKQQYGSKDFHVDSTGRMYLCLTVIRNMDAIADTITSWGGVINNRGSNSLYAHIPLDKLADLPALDGVVFIDAVGHPVTHAGKVLSAGDKQLLADSARAMFYTDGADANGNKVKVGVISDGVHYYSNSIQSGDLPSSIGLFPTNGVDATRCIGSEGTAMMEIIHDLAPNASLCFGGASGYIDANNNTIAFTPLDMANVITAMSTSPSGKCKVIVDDLAEIIGEPWFEEYEVSQAILSFQQNGGTYISAAGNYAQNMYAGKPSIKTNGNKNWVLFNGSDTSLTINISNYKSIFVALQWDDMWGYATADYDLWLYDNNWNLIDYSATSGGALPQEWIHPSFSDYLNNNTFHVMVSYQGYVPASTLKNVKVLVLPEDGNPSAPKWSFTLSNTTSTGHIFGHQATRNCISVAAYSALSPNSIESFSSHGPSLMFTARSPGNENSRQTPVITATDGVATKVGKDGHFGSDSLFYGTSAAAPHVAAIAALYYSRYPTQTLSQFTTAICSTGKTIAGKTGGTWNSTSGSGKISAYDALLSGMPILNNPQVTSNSSWDLVHVKGIATVSSGVTIAIDQNYTTYLDGTVNLGTSASIVVRGTLILSSTATVVPASGLVAVSGGRIVGGNLLTVNVNQLDESSNPFGAVGRWVSGRFDSSNVPYSFPSFASTRERMRGRQQPKTGTTQKFHLWNNINTRIMNPDTFTINPVNRAMTSQFMTANNATVQAQLLEGGPAGGAVNFKDPWLIDASDQYGSRNQGMSAPFKSLASGTNNIGTSTNYNGVFLNQSFGGSAPYYSVSVPQTQSIGSYTGLFQNWSGTNATFQNATALQTGVVFGSSGAIAAAQYKGIHLSNNASAFSNNSQRKLVRTKDTPIGWLHQVYESMGRVWLEHSTDNGTTWFLGNSGKPLDNGAGKCPSIDWHYNTADPNNANYNAVVVAFQQQSGSTYTIQYAVFKYTNGSYVRQDQYFKGPLYLEPTGGDQYSTTNANPNIAWAGVYRFLLSFERKITAGGMSPGIYWIYGSMDEGGVEPLPPNYTTPYFSNPTLISGTTSSSTNAVASLNKTYSGSSSDFHIIYQESNSSIKEASFNCTYNGSNWVPSVVDPPRVISTGSSAMYNYKPTAVQMLNGDYRLCWIRDLYGAGSLTPQYVNIVYLSSLWASVVNTYGNMVNSVSLNILDDNTNFKFAYAQKTNNSTWQNFASNGPGIISLSTTGQYIQLSNGPSSGAMYASSYYPASLPYYFQNISLSGLSKSAGEEYTYGRGVALNGLGFFYSLKSLTVDKSNIRFAEIPERNDATTRRRGMQYIPLDSLNTMLISEPFTVGEGTSFSFSDDGGFTDSSAVKEVLGKKGYISCKLELIDDATGKTVGAMKESKFSLSRSFRGNLSASRLNLKGMGTKNVRVKITVSSNVDSLNGVWVNEYGTITDDALAKLTVNELTLQAPEIIKEYALEQNFPNPFNPSTTIRYQLPNAGHVILKVYDMLGREVATLVDQVQEQGRYSAAFDASRLASGVYISRLAAGDYTKTMKMVLMK